MERIKSLIMKWNHTKLNGQSNKTISLLQQFKQKQIKTMKTNIANEFSLSTLWYADTIIR